MAFSTSGHGRTPQSPLDDAPFSSYASVTSPLRGMAGGMPQRPGHSSSTSTDARAGLPRRFTTNTVPTVGTLSSMSPLSPIGQQRRQAAESTDLTSATYHKLQLLEKKRLELEYSREQKRRFEAELELMNVRDRTQEDEIKRLSNEVHRFSFSGFASEPTTPPEFNEKGFPSALSRPNRFSSSSITSPPGVHTLSSRTSRSGSQAQPPAYHTHSASISHLPSKSVPGSRRGSDEEEDSFEADLAQNKPRPGASLNRISLPVTGLDNLRLNEFRDVDSILGINKFLFEDDEKPMPSHSAANNNYLHMDTTNDKFPILVRRDGDTFAQLSASSAALDLALSQSPGPEAQQSNGWPSFARHRHGQLSMPMNTLRSSDDADEFEFPPDTTGSGFAATPTKANPNRHSMDMMYNSTPLSETKTKRVSIHATPTNGASGGMPKLQSSYSTNDIPTLKGSNGVNGINGFGNTTGVAKSHAEQHRHNHNASLGRFPPNATNNRHSLEISTESRADESKSFRSHISSLQANAAPFGPGTAPAAASSMPTDTTPGVASPPALASYNSQQFYNAYGMVMNGMHNMNLGSQQPWNNQMQMYPGAGYGQYAQAYQNYGPARFPDSQARVIQDRRIRNSEDNSRFNNMSLDQMVGSLHEYCKDQHGCRFLQKKLEERNSDTLRLIFEETKDYVVELMIDPFGNYLCQKLLEYTNDEQRTVLINNAASDMVKIALNQHGTRALQKMIEYISTREQIQTIIHALGGQVVRLIQDLNGNHVVQKCLNHLSSQDAQFIFDAVSQNCVTVGTHRHGCCVIQRCIDHADESQKTQLVVSITRNSYQLVQDPFGNYVVQYILDLGEPQFTQPMCQEFLGNIATLSKQKFSSNVIEKCIRVADDNTKRSMIEELLDRDEIEKIIRDSFANYVIQTAMDYADPETKARLYDAIVPIIPSIRNTPYGRRIMSKISDRDIQGQGQGQGQGRKSGPSSGQITPHESQTPRTLPASSYGPRQVMSNGSTFSSPDASFNGINGYSANIASPQPHRLSNPPLPAQLQNTVHQPFGPYGRGSQLF